MMMTSDSNALSTLQIGFLEAFAPLDRAVAGFLARYRGTVFLDYRTDLRHFTDWCAVHGLAPLQAGRPHLELYVRWLEQQGWASSTVARRFGTVALFYRYATLDELIAKDPALNVTRPQVRRDEQRRTFLTPLE